MDYDAHTECPDLLMQRTIRCIQERRCRFAMDVRMWKDHHKVGITAG